MDKKLHQYIYATTGLGKKNLRIARTVLLHGAKKASAVHSVGFFTSGRKTFEDKRRLNTAYFNAVGPLMESTLLGRRLVSLECL